MGGGVFGGNELAVWNVGRLWAMEMTGKEDDGGKPGGIPFSLGGRARPPSVNDGKVTGVGKQTLGKARSTPDFSEGDDAALGVVTHFTGNAGTTPGEEDDGVKPGCTPPSQGGRARPLSVNDEEATGVAKQTSGKAGSTPESSEGDDVVTEMGDDGERATGVDGESDDVATGKEADGERATGVDKGPSGRARFTQTC